MTATITAISTRVAAAGTLRSDADADGPIARHARPVLPSWLDERPPAQRWLLEQPDPDANGYARQGWLPLGTLGMLAAAGGAGKTMALIQLALCVASGRDWFGMHVATPGRVLLALGEEDRDEVHRRVYRAARQLGLTAEERERVAEGVIAAPLAGERLALLERDPAGNLTETEVLRDLRRTLSAHDDWRLVVLDPLTRWAGPDAETDSAHATQTVEAVESLLSAPGRPTVLVAHHTTKMSRRDGDSTAVAARGSGALVDGPRWCATMSPGQVGPLRTVTLEVVKANRSAPGEPVMLVREDGGMLRPLREGEADDLQDEEREQRLSRTRERVLSLAAEGSYTSVSQLREAMGGRRNDVQQAVAQLVGRGELAKDSNRAPYRLPKAAE